MDDAKGGNMESLQKKYSPDGKCFGCGPANEKGLRIDSIVQGNEVVAHWKPEPHHEAFPGVLNGGVIGALLDCHSNWTAAWAIMNQRKEDHPPCTVTADYAIKLTRPTPTNGEIELVSEVDEITGDKATISAELIAGGKVC